TTGPRTPTMPHAPRCCARKASGSPRPTRPGRRCGRMRANRANACSAHSDFPPMSADASDALTRIVIGIAHIGPPRRDAVARALASTASVELIVVDNASADGERERVQGAHAGDARLRVIVNDRNVGFGAACNRGAAIARGATLLFLNPDCLIEPGLVA